jgi:hypothetical protein
MSRPASPVIAACSGCWCVPISRPLPCPRESAGAQRFEPLGRVILLRREAGKAQAGNELDAGRRLVPRSTAPLRHRAPRTVPGRYGKGRTTMGRSAPGSRGYQWPNDAPAAPWSTATSGSWPGTALATPATGCREPTWSSRSRPQPPSSSASPGNDRGVGGWSTELDLTMGGGNHPLEVPVLSSAARPTSGVDQDHRSGSSPTAWKAPSGRPSGPRRQGRG